MEHHLPECFFGFFSRLLVREVGHVRGYIPVYYIPRAGSGKLTKLFLR